MSASKQSTERRTVDLLTAPRVAVPPSRAEHSAALRNYASRTSSAADTIPVCLRCGTDENLIYSEYREQRVLPNGRIESARARYCCTRCGAGRQHTVPASWRPPGWFWCT